jgi:hypothetical protein
MLLSGRCQPCWWQQCGLACMRSRLCSHRGSLGWVGENLHSTQQILFVWEHWVLKKCARQMFVSLTVFLQGSLW